MLSASAMAGQYLDYLTSIAAAQCSLLTTPCIATREGIRAQDRMRFEMSRPNSWLRFVTTPVLNQSCSLSIENLSNPGVLTHRTKVGLTYEPMVFG